ncbi:hypothetical protein OS493_039609 [Desmophyllum pertusum]|uniref:Uncharacterized protein n=1 Tax=Desmophyllum pertusum TaxID=174260 RepID=A0A9W9YU25_9CNID|nr:hypothetical protein OS493_039609 [Desmophyllum pertusum]
MPTLRSCNKEKAEKVATLTELHKCFLKSMIMETAVELRAAITQSEDLVHISKLLDRGQGAMFNLAEQQAAKTPLCLAFQNGHKQPSEGFLLENNADVNMRDKHEPK